ncbi:aromatic compound dioxygenase [Apiospora kogelbergensis]|uniref:aromatic compound dioxygenase n=1 Tax=Apiospora kogelbergensis TaxID=1337665 RepID=UPI0031305E7A
MVKISLIATALAACDVAMAHPGEDTGAGQIKRDAVSYNHAHQHMLRAMSGCANSPPVLARQQRAVARRAETARQLREKRGISHPMKRDEADLKKWAGDSHKVDANYDPSTPSNIIFSGNASCALVEETTIGPYFVSGELMRTNVSEGQKGVPLHLDIQFISTSNCSPVKDMIIDVWHSNATGVYSGVNATGQGGLGSNFCRGVQVSDAEGVVEFDTVFPGHYAGRANHIHILSTRDAKVLSDRKTYEGGVATHVGQLFFDRELVSAVERLEPYKGNTQQFIDLLEDGIAEAAATSDYDVLMDYQMLGGALSDGVLAWITVGVNVSANYNDQAPAAAHFTGSSSDLAGGSSSALLSTPTTTSAPGAPDSGTPASSSTPASGAVRRSSWPLITFMSGWSALCMLLF